MSQTTTGKAFEYALALALVRILEAEHTEDSAWNNAYKCYKKDGNLHMDKAASEAVIFLLSFDKGLEHAERISIQADRVGADGDVRDIIAHSGTRKIGFSAKNNHHAVKHQRLSDMIDFGKEWADYPVSNQYWQRINPVFAELRKLREEKRLFRDLDNKEEEIYLPVLIAFEEEMKRLCDEFGKQFIERMFSYLVGRYDFYKIILEPKKDHVVVHPYNINGTLGYGQKWRIPTRLEQIKRKPDSHNTLILSFPQGWQISFRIHNASSAIEPSLKFDVQFLSVPTYTTVFHIPLSN